MIGYLNGTILNSGSNEIILDVNGVGYEMSVPGIFVEVGEQRAFFVHTHVRENEIRLFGFADKMQLDMFRMLLLVNGVGPKAAMTLLASLDIQDIADAILSENEKKLSVKGLGPKTARKIILELKNRIGENFAKSTSKGKSSNLQLSQQTSVADETMQALISLGYSQSEVSKAMDSVDMDGMKSVGEAVRKLLSAMR